MDKKSCLNNLNRLLQKYGVPVKDAAFLEGGPPSLVLGGDAAPLLYWRQERRFKTLRTMLHDVRSEDICVMRVLRIVPKGEELRCELLRELDLCEWILQSRICSVFMSQNSCTANLVVKLQNKAVATLEVAATLPPGEAPVDRHEVNTRCGVISDRVVDTQVPQKSMYLFTQNQQSAYTDTDFELYGMDQRDILLVRSAFEILYQDGFSQAAVNADWLQHVLHKAECSAKSNQKQDVTII